MTPERSDPQVLKAICEQGYALHRAGRFDEAERCYDRVLKRNPKHFAALHLLGVVRVQTGRAEQAVELLRRAAKINPDDPAVQDNLGAALCETGRPEAALANHERALALKPDFADAHYNRGVALDRLKRPEEALASYDAAIAQAPGHVRAHHNRGTALDILGRTQEALASYDRAIALKPDYAEAFANRGQVLGDLGRLGEALASFNAAITLDPGFAYARACKSLVLLRTGQFEAGWREYEWRKANWDAAKRLDPGRAWSGEGELAGKRLFLHCEQGLGDSLQCARYVPLLADRGAEITLYTQSSLVSLLGASLPGVSVAAEGGPPPDFDFHCSLMSLPLAFETRLETIPPPLRLRSGERRPKFADRFGPKSRPRIGLAWSGNPTHVNDRNRSIAFDRLAPLLGEEIEWIALQNEIRPRDSAAFAASGRVTFLGDALNDFADTAALVEQMDLVITVDTSLAHLAGSLGKPTWILLPFAPDWRWLLDRADSPWYPTARLFRQPAIGDWDSVIAEVQAALRSTVGCSA
ncbi:MAG: tetratricopeptide repeat-containing glycosyltransferase family protein [Caulobacteraceae bacterium]|nr:tetratricopeptide repeat-containing glycosyltransferase family protein [Caulobacteraceae bacterium]